MNKNHDVLLNRLPTHPRTAAIRASAEATLAVGERYAARRAEMAASGKFTESGVNTAMRDLLPVTLRSLQTAKSPIAVLKREIEAKRAALRPADPDPANLAGAIQQMEIRTFLRSLNPIDRDALLLSTNDIRLLAAAVSAPPELSGFSGNYHETIDRIEVHHIELEFPADVAELRAMEALAAEADAIATVARGTLRDVAKLEPQNFEAEAKKVEAAVWLIGPADKPQVCEVDANGTATYRAASDDEAASGVRYASIHEYHAARVA
jgi:hypothetical protein